MGSIVRRLALALAGIVFLVMCWLLCLQNARASCKRGECGNAFLSIESGTDQAMKYHSHVPDPDAISR